MKRPAPLSFEYECRYCGRWFWSDERQNPGICPDCEHDLEMEAPGHYPLAEEDWDR